MAFREDKKTKLKQSAQKTFFTTSPNLVFKQSFLYNNVVWCNASILLLSPTSAVVIPIYIHILFDDWRHVHMFSSTGNRVHANYEPFDILFRLWLVLKVICHDVIILMWWYKPMDLFQLSKSKPTLLLTPNLDHLKRSLLTPNLDQQKRQNTTLLKVRFKPVRSGGLRRRSSPYGKMCEQVWPPGRYG